MVCAAALILVPTHVAPLIKKSTAFGVAQVRMQHNVLQGKYLLDDEAGHLWVYLAAAERVNI